MKGLKLLPCALILLFARPVFAENEVRDGVRITCIPELEYLEIETMTVVVNVSDLNLKQINTRDLEAFENTAMNKNGIYTVDQIVSSPINCTIGKYEIRVAIENRLSPHAGGECSSADHFDISIIENGRMTYSFSAYGTNRCVDNESHLIDIDASGYVRDCRLIGSGESQCETRPLIDSSGNQSELAQ